jgi:eukaryotic-like serine/threonine-protein kinase
MEMFDTTQTSYVRLRKIYGERTRNIVTGIGSGLSQSAGLPTWQGLRDRLLEEGESKAKTLDRKDADRLRRSLSSIRHSKDNWLSFERLRDELGNASFQAAVRDALSPRPDVQCPDEYNRLWRLKIGGMLTLNLERFAARSFAEENHIAMHEMSGREVAGRMAVLKSGAPFIVNLHGILEDASTWILTRDDLGRLFEQPGYQTFIFTILATATILFMGISADDLAAGGLLAKLRAQGVDPGQHFWLTNRTDKATDDWAEKSGIQVIRYEAETASAHQKSLATFFDDMRRFMPQDELDRRPVIVSTIKPLRHLPPPNQLANEEPETIRQALASHVKSLLNDNPSGGETEYNEFLKQYQRAIHNAWYVSETPPENVLFGYSVSEAIGSGAFAKVYRGTSMDGEVVAIKLLRAEVVQDERMLGSFRRGVRSMKILSDSKVRGMVPYREAYELPACAIMEFIEGPNLQEAVESMLLDPWKDGLRIILDAAKIIRSGHLLPEQVLHRDIRPPNIMLKNFFVTDNCSE